MDQSYVLMPAGPEKVTEAPGVTASGPIMSQVGRGLTVKTTSSCFVQPAESVTVRRKVAVAGAPLTCTVAGNVVQIRQEVGASMVAPAVEETTLHAIEAMGLILGWAVPVRAKAVESPSEHLVWAGPASASPSVRSTWIGVIKSVRLAVCDWASLVLTRIVLTPMLVQGLKAMPMRAVRSTAASAKVFLA